MSTRSNRWIGLALVPPLLCGCYTEVQLAPRSFAWGWGEKSAVWRSEGFEVTTDLRTEVVEFPVRAIVRADSPGATVSFEVPAAAGPEPIGLIVVDGKTQPIVAGSWYTIPAGAGAGTPFNLRPYAPWPDPPAVDTAVDYVLVLSDSAGIERCPFRFRVESTTRRLIPEVRVAIGVVVLICVLLLALCLGTAAAFDNADVNISVPELRMDPALSH